MTAPSIPGASDYLAGRTTFLAGLHPRRAIELPLEAVLDLLRQRFGTPIETALSLPAVDLARPVSELPDEVRSPTRGEPDSTWLKRTNMVGVNIRTVEDYAGLIKYTLTLSGAFDSIHLLPIWEPGVVESLYGIAGWNLNKEFWSQELFDVAPHLDTVDRQLRAASNLLHVMGRTIGMDVIPHTDRFSEVAVGNPQLFEWMVVRDRTIVDHSASLHERAMVQVHQWLVGVGSATAGAAMPTTVAELFAIPEEQRLAILFGDPDDFLARIERRVDLIKHLKRQGLEPVPATMGVPFRGIKVDPDVQHTAIDDDGLEWPDYVITRPEGMSRVFSPLARFKLYGSLDDNAEWEIDFADRRTEVWDYVCERYARVQQIGNFDFMRGDMSHVQMRPDGVPSDVDEFYDILGAVKRYIQRSADAPWFAYFAETFLPPRDTFQYGEELDHLDVSLADATLGDLQSTVVGSPVFLQRFRRYLDDLATRHTAPAFTLMTADKDDPRFDEFYRAGNEVRMFTALFLPDMPSYMGLGFEVRDVHWEPVENERYTKLFVFREKGESNIYPSKARHGNEFLWGDNRDLFERLTALRRYADEILPGLKETSTRWLIPPDSTAHRGIACWTQQGDERFVFSVNYQTDRPSGYFGIPDLDPELVLHAEFSTTGEVAENDRRIEGNGFFHRLEDLAPGEGRVYRVER